MPTVRYDLAMRVRIEQTWVTRPTGTRVVSYKPDYTVVEADSFSKAILDFIVRDGARLLGMIIEKEDKAVATAWKNRVYLLCAQAAPD